MQPLPPDAAVDPVGSTTPGRFLLDVARRQSGTLALGAAAGSVWMLAQALVPWALGRAVDGGLAAGDVRAVAGWAGVLLGLALTQAGVGTVRHRFAVSCWLRTALGSSRLVGHHVAGVGGALPHRLPTGEVVSTVATDAVRIGDAFEVAPRAAGAVVSAAVVASLLLQRSPVLGVVVLVGVPATTAVLGLVVRPLERRQSAHRSASGGLTALGADTVAGLRVLRGVGGEEVFLRRYVERSQAVRRAGERVAGVQAGLDALQVLLPGLLLAVVTWLGARSVVAGTLTPGELVAFYGWAAFLVLPVRTATELVQRVVAARVAARHLLAVLAVRRAAGEPDAAVPEPPAGARLVDPRSGLAPRPGALTVVVADEGAAGAALAARLGRLRDDDGPPAELGGVPLTRLPVAVVRRRVVVGAGDADLFTGPLRRLLDPRGCHADAVVGAAVAAACADDVLAALPRGLAEDVDERGRSLSGGQRQRLALARALLTAADVLVLVDPTSAVDAHTEAAIAGRLRVARSGRTTVVVTTSPLLAGRADEVVLLLGGRVVATGTHDDLLRRRDGAGRGYRRLVLRDEAEDGGDGPPAAGGTGPDERAREVVG